VSGPDRVELGGEVDPLPPEPPRRDPDVIEPTSSGLSPVVAAALACLGGWVTGLIFLAVERESRYVRFHAAQAVVGIGGLWAAGVGCWVASFLAVFLSTTAFRVMMAVAQAFWVASIVVWALCLYKAYRGEWWQLPYAGNVARRIVGAAPSGGPILRGKAPHISPFQSSGSGCVERKISRCHFPPPQGSITSAAMTSTSISANVRPSGSPSR